MVARQTIIWLFLGKTGFVLLLFVRPAYSQNSLDLKQLLLTPGKLTQSHAHLENQCKQCHEHFDKSEQAPLCLDCHKTIKADLDNKTGFHSTIEQPQLNQCSSCHSDHLGPDANIMGFDTDIFDHDRTDFPLKESHVRVSCNSCHDKTHPKSNKPTFLLESTECSSCHKDPHEGKLKDDCSSCHSQSNWQVPKFDHSKTDFLLKGKHQDLACVACHVNDVADPVGNQCSNCHRSNDKHLGIFGDKCESCHVELGWAETSYDHFKETKYALKGKHQPLECAACHYEQLNPKKTCQNCHGDNDIHLGGNGNECQQCHNNDEWSKTQFDHDKDTGFRLQGAHKKQVCASCHLPGQIHQQSDVVRQCKDCHNANDPHQGALGDTCQTCHQQDKWDQQVTFSHEFTNFPLTGGHQLLVCQSCHDSAGFTNFIDKPTACIDCHQQDDLHQTTLGTQCSSCHNSSSWTSWQFDHQKQTDYPLEGAHNNLSCDLCHSPDLPKPLEPAKTCIGCHQQDDIHKGTFGKDCQQCHTTESFYDVQR